VVGQGQADDKHNYTAVVDVT